MRACMHLRLAVLWHDTVYDEMTVTGAGPVTIGSGPRCTLSVPTVDHTLLSPDGAGGWVLHLASGATGRLRARGVVITVAEARARGATLGLEVGDWAVLDLGPCAVFVQPAEPATRVPRLPLYRRLDGPGMAGLLAALVVHFGVLISAFATWDQRPTLRALDDLVRDPWVLAALKAPPEIEPLELHEAPVADAGGKRAQGDEGTFGEPEKAEPTKFARRDADLTDRVRKVGAVKALGSELLGRGPLKSVFGSKTGFVERLDSGMAGLSAVYVPGRGNGGLGLRSVGPGGGGGGHGVIGGTQRLDLGRGRGGAKSRLRQARKRPKPLRIRRPEHVGGHCKPADIQRVVELRRRGVSYCYERELAGNPELAGKLTMGWRINPDGKVSGVRVEADSVRNQAMQRCVKRAIRRWRFPKPEGGLCQVRFPFVFSAGL